MSATLGERVIEAVAALLESVRIVDGWLTESGSDVRREEVGVEIADGSEATPSEAPTSEQEVATYSGDIVTLGN